MDRPLSGLRHKIGLLAERNYARFGPLPVLERDSEEWKAWRQWRLDNGLTVGFMNSREQWTAPTHWPPVSIDVELETAFQGNTKKLAEKLGL